MKINDAKELQAMIASIRAKAFDEVVKLIDSNLVKKDKNGLIMMYDDDLITLVRAIDKKS